MHTLELNSFRCTPRRRQKSIEIVYGSKISLFYHSFRGAARVEFAYRCALSLVYGRETLLFSRSFRGAARVEFAHCVRFHKFGYFSIVLVKQLLLLVNYFTY